MPLSYFQVVVLATYSYFMILAFAGSYRWDSSRKIIDLHRSYMSTASLAEEWQLLVLANAVTVLHFTICAGILCTARSLIVPFNSDDVESGIDVEAFAQRHLDLSYIIVDDMSSVFPELQNDSELRTKIARLSSLPSFGAKFCTESK